MRRFTPADMRRNLTGALRATQWAMMPTYNELRPIIDAEVRRCRRYERPLTVVVLAPQIAAGTNGHGGNGAHAENGNGKSKGAGAPDLWGAFSMQLGFLLLGSILRGTLRETDIVAYGAEKHHFVLLLPEVDATGALGAVIASYPKHGLTVDDLIEHARSSWSAVPAEITSTTLPRKGDSA